MICTLAVAVAGSSDFSSGSGPTKTVSLIKLLLGLSLLFAAFRQWRTRPKPGEAPTMPKWLNSIDQFTPARSFAIGAALSAINPKNLGMSLAAGLTIAQTGLTTGAAGRHDRHLRATGGRTDLVLRADQVRDDHVPKVRELRSTIGAVTPGREVLLTRRPLTRS